MDVINLKEKDRKSYCFFCLANFSLAAVKMRYTQILGRYT
jgi:hypothetical protein